MEHNHAGKDRFMLAVSFDVPGTMSRALSLDISTRTRLLWGLKRLASVRMQDLLSHIPPLNPLWFLPGKLFNP